MPRLLKRGKEGHRPERAERFFRIYDRGTDVCLWKTPGGGDDDGEVVEKT